MKYIGIDVSKNTFDAWTKTKGHHSFSNTKAGFKAFVRWVEDGHCVLESTSMYHMQLALYLHEAGFTLSVVNPLRVKRFMQMRLQRSKTDKSDAMMLAAYGLSEQPSCWEPDPLYVTDGKQLLGVRVIHASTNGIKKQVR